jgi:chromate transporter
MAEPMRRLVVERRGWVSQREFLDGLAYCQLLPGAIMVSLVTYLGQRLRRTPGAVTAAVSFILPAFALMLGLSALYFRYRELTWVQALSRGMGTLVLALVLQAAWQLGRRIGRQWPDFAIMGAAMLAFWQEQPFPLVFLAAAGARAGLGRWFPLGEVPHGEAAPAAIPWRRLALQGGVMGRGVGGLLAGLHGLDPQLATLSGICLKIGALSFGGGMVMIPALQWEMVDRQGWLTLSQFLDGILLGFLTPGPIIILSTFVGYAVRGLAGAAAATVSAFFPAVALVLLSAPFYRRVKEAAVVRPLIQGVLAALIGMLLVMLAQLGQTALADWREAALFLAAAVALLGLRLHLVWVAAAVGAASVWLF